MKPNFALNLSHEGISLLHRAKAGWLRVGDVALDDPDLTEQLQVLRRTAADLENRGLTTKLVIPNSQILYTEIEAPGPDTATRIAQIRDGLVGLTPYDVNDLIFDWHMVDSRAHLAVVARDTLREAESFATEYRFNPVSFVAVPVNGAFEGEPFFGPTQHAASLLADGEAVERDSRQIAVLGSASAVLGSPPKARAKASPATAKPDPEPTQPAADANAAADPAPKPDQKAAARPADAGEAEAQAAAKPEPAPGGQPAGAATPVDPPELAVTFASRRRAGAASPPHTPSPPSAPSPGETQAPELRPGAADADIPPAPNGFHHAEPAPKPAARESSAPPPPRRLTKAERHPSDDAPAPSDPVPDRTPMPMTAPHTADVLDPAEKAAERRRRARQKAKAAKTALVGTLGKIGRGTTQGATQGARQLGQRPETVASSDTEAAAMTVFGARGHGPQRGKPKYLGLALTLLLLLALAVLALWSTYFMSDVTSGWFGTVQDEPEIAAPSGLTQPADPITAPPPITNDIEPALAPDTPAPQPADDTSVLADTVAQPDPQIPEAPQSPIDAAVETALGLTPAEPETPTPGGPVDGTTELALLGDPAAPEIAAPEPAAPDPEVAVLAPQPPPTRAEAEARYAATGIWQLDPEPLGDSPGGGDRVDDVYVASIDPVISAQDAIALPDAAGLATDLRPPVLNPPAPLGTVFEFDERGLVPATPEGVVTPDGVQVFSGRPSVAPGPRPANLVVPQDETRNLINDRLRELRPSARPGGLAEANERARLGGFSSTELAALRPSVRPLSLQEQRAGILTRPETEQGEGATGEADFENDHATELAVAASRAPSGRPGNFSSVIQKALEEAATSQPETGQNTEVAAVAAPRVPSIPTRASVAKEATVQNAINLKKVNLIGIYGSPSDRRALVRLSSGKYVKVEVGDRVDGGRVAAIGDGELRYIKRGRNITLKMPKG